MLREKLTAIAAGACLALAMPAALAEKSTSEHVDDTAIAASAKTALVDADKVSANDINIEVYKGVVQLAGFVDSQEEKDAAIAVARKVTGVVDVIDGMVVRDGSRSLGQTVDDSTIQTKLKTKLTGEQGMEKALAINTEVREGDVLLSGFVSDETHKAKAGEIATGIAGVRNVHNMIAIKP